MKQALCILFALAMVFSLFACQKEKAEGSDESTGNKIQDTADRLPAEPFQSRESDSSVPAQPISFSNLSDLQTFLSSSEKDLESYPAEFREAYSKMTDSFQKAGYLFSAEHPFAECFNETITLYPEAPYEDSGLQFVFQYQKKLIHVYFYLAQDEIHSQTGNDIFRYRDQRFGFPGEAMAFDSENPAFSHAQLFRLSDDSYQVWTFVDGSYYALIRSDLPGETLSAFIKNLTFQQVPLES